MNAHPTITIDPGVRGCGLAVWRSGGLAFAAYLPRDTRPGPSCVAMGRALDHALAGRVWSAGAVEWPVQRHGAAHYVRRSDISDLTAVAAVCAYVLSQHGAEVLTPLPERWKGQVPKHIHTARVIGGALAREKLPRVEGYQSSAPGLLSGLELSRICWETRALSHNIVDAIGIGLWALGRTPNL